MSGELINITVGPISESPLRSENVQSEIREDFLRFRPYHLAIC